MVAALEGISVLDCTQGMAGALATMFLSDFGADVIRIERPDNGPVAENPAYRVWNRGKRSVHLDILQDADAFERLAARADVLVESFTPGSPHQSVADYAKLSASNPRLVHCSITAYGQRGPLRNEPPDHDLVMARLGISSTQPSFRDGPVHVVHPIPSVGAALLAAQGIVASLYAREQTGLGRKVDTSLMAGALIYSAKSDGENLTPRPFRSVPAGGGPFYSVYECADGEWIQLGCIHSGFVDLAAAVMGIADVMTNPEYGDGRMPRSEEARQELFDIVAGVIKTRPYEDWAKTFEDADVPYARAGTVEDAMTNPQVLFNKLVHESIDAEVGPILQIGLPIKLSQTPGKVPEFSPTTGEHTSQVMSEVGEVSALPAQEPTERDLRQPPPLSGVKILEIANVIAGPAAGKMLADLGADVVKLESLYGDISRPAGSGNFLYMNSNKRSVSVDTRTEEGKQVARKLAAKADLLLANMRPGATDRMGIGSDVLATLNPDIIETHVTAFGWDGPFAHRPGVDPLAQAWMGLQRTQGGEGNPPVFLSRLAPTDYTSAALGALTATLALYVKAHTGIAQRADTNLLSGGAVMMSESLIKYDGKPPRALADKDHYGTSALHRLYQTRDGWVYIAADEKSKWASLCLALGDPELADDPRFATAEVRIENDSILADTLSRRFAVDESSAILEKLADKNIPCAPVVEGYDQSFFDEPQVLENRMFVEHHHPVAGKLKLSANLIQLGNTLPISARVTPMLGQHTRDLLCEIGYSQAEIDDLYEKGIVKTEHASDAPGS